MTTREEWLEKAIAELSQKFKDAGHPLPKKIRVSIGFPSRGALSKSRRTIGQCWAPEVSADGSIHVFVSPVLGTAIDILDTLAHELVHAAVGCEHGHRAPFVRCCTKVGMTKGKPTSRGAGAELRAELEELAERLGAFPHAALKPSEKMKPQSTRLLKAECGDCGYVIRVTRKWVDESGLPTCPCGTLFELAV